MCRAAPMVLFLVLLAMRTATRAEEATAVAAPGAPPPSDPVPAEPAPPWWSPRNLLSLGPLEVSSWRDILQPGQWSGAIDSGMDSYRQTTRAADGAASTLKGRLVTNGVTLRNESFSLIDPRLLVGNVGLRLALQKSEQQADNTNSGHTAELIGYNFDATVLAEKPYNATFFAARSHNVSARITGGMTDAKNDNYGLTVRVREDNILRDKELLPYFSATFEARQDHTQEVTSVAGQSFRRDEKRTLLGLRGHNGFQTADLDFHLERTELENIIYPAGTYQSNAAIVSYSLDFGPNLNRRWDSRVTYNSRAGATSLTNFDVSQRLAVEHRPNLSTSYFYDYSQHESQDFTTNAHSAGATLQHVLYQNLTSSVGLLGTHQTLPSGTIDTRAAQASLGYNRRIPWNGRLTIGVGGSFQITDNKLQSGLVAVSDVPFAVPPVLGAGAGFTLNERFVVTETIVVVVVRGGARLPTVAGVDYTVLVEGDRTRILPQPTSAVILPGDLVEVSYTYRLDPSLKFQTVSRSISAGVDFGWIGLSAAHDDTTQKPLSGGDAAFISNRRRDTARLDLRGSWAAFQGRADATVTRYNYTELVYDEWRLTQSVTYAPRGNLMMSASADQFQATYKVPVRQSSGQAVRLDLDWYYGGWWLAAYGSRRVLRDTLVPTDEITEYALRLRRTWPKLDVTAVFGLTERVRGSVQTNNLHFHIAAVRRF